MGERADNSITVSSTYRHARTHVILLVADLHVRVVDAVTGELLRDLIIDPTRDYQPQNKRKPPNPYVRGFPMS
ncbi:hypothetical protein [Nonomuraea sp. NBC_01738]|uniref:hypothetical protein n=1 Tax=Nonomuraea sp. NBC_01738 TaxID=2976003 RepID=UPI003FA3DCF8